MMPYSFHVHVYVEVYACIHTVEHWVVTRSTRPRALQGMSYTTCTWCLVSAQVLRHQEGESWCPRKWTFRGLGTCFILCVCLQACDAHFCIHGLFLVSVRDLQHFLGKNWTEACASSILFLCKCGYESKNARFSYMHTCIDIYMHIHIQGRPCHPQSDFPHRKRSHSGIVPHKIMCRCASVQVCKCASVRGVSWVQLCETVRMYVHVHTDE